MLGLSEAGKRSAFGLRKIASVPAGTVCKTEKNVVSKRLIRMGRFWAGLWFGGVGLWRECPLSRTIKSTKVDLTVVAAHLR